MSSSDHPAPKSSSAVTTRPPPARKPSDGLVGGGRSAAGGPREHRPVRCTGYGLTDLGRRRPSNEDAFFIDDELGLYVVADGMGGHAAGEVASREAVDTIYGMVKRGLGKLTELTDPVAEADMRA